MTDYALEAIRAQVKEHGEIPVSLEIGYTVVYSTLQGNIPVTNRVSGSILHFPVNLELHFLSVPNTMGYYPVNTRVTGTIGDTPVEARMMHHIVFSTIAGNIPINTEVVWEGPGASYRLITPHTLLSASSRIGGAAAAGKKVIGGGDMKYVRGRLIDVSKKGGGGGGSTIQQEAGRPVLSGLRGRIEDVEVDLRFSFTYFCNTSSGRNPVINRAEGFLRDALSSNNG